MKCAACRREAECNYKVNLMEEWKEQHEWTNYPRRGKTCRECAALAWSGASSKDYELRCEPMPMVIGPQKFWDDVTATCVGIFDGEFLGFRCAKRRYGIDAVAEIIQGYCYDGMYGTPICRATAEKIPETNLCGCCRLTLYQCNALEVTV